MDGGKREGPYPVLEDLRVQDIFGHEHRLEEHLQDKQVRIEFSLLLVVNEVTNQPQAEVADRDHVLDPDLEGARKEQLREQVPGDTEHRVELQNPVAELLVEPLHAEENGQLVEEGNRHE